MSDMDPLCPPLGLPDNESRTHRRSLRERACDVLYVHAIEQVASGGAEHREEHDCPLHQGPEGGKGRTTLRPASCRALPRRTHTMRGNPRPRVAMGLPGSGCGVSLRLRPELRKLLVGFAPGVGPRGSAAGSRDAQPRRYAHASYGAERRLRRRSWFHELPLHLRDERRRACRRRRPSAHASDETPRMKVENRPDRGPQVSATLHDDLGLSGRWRVRLCTTPLPQQPSAPPRAPPARPLTTATPGPTFVVLPAKPLSGLDPARVADLY